ncbi:MAG: hypothetical protein ACRD4P_16870, partial [Bryobacteraceae bacterium]
SHVSRRSLFLVFCCTLIGAVAQMLIKTGANHLTQPSLWHTIIAMVTNLRLIAGYSLYGVSTIFLVGALREGQLSILYPVIALTYVWVCVLSVFYLHESMNVYKLVGIAVIVLGVAILGRSKT